MPDPTVTTPALRGLTIRQPWASLIALGVKTIETRSWATSYRGPLVIHAGKRRPTVLEAMLLYEAGVCSHLAVPFVWAKTEPLVPYGAIVATCELVDVIPTYPHMAVRWPDQMPYGDFTPGRFAWVLENIEPLAVPVPAKGRLGLWKTAA